MVDGEEQAAAGPDGEGAPVAATDDSADWTAIRADYARDLNTTVRGVAKRHGVSVRALQERIEAEDWPRRRPRSTTRERIARTPISRAALIRRMVNVLERQLTRLETDDVALTDKEVALLGSMSSTLGKLMEPDSTLTRTDETKAATSAELEELRKKIAERIEQLNQG